MESTTGENEKRLLAGVLKERLIKGKNTIIYKELLEQELPTFLRNYLQSRVQKYFHTDEPIQFKNSKRYDFNYERIRKLKDELNNAFEEATIFTKEEIVEIIHRTIGLQFDLLVNPNETLDKILFKNKSERTQSDILTILSGLIDNRKFIHQLIQKVKEFDQFHIIQDDFHKILNKTHDEVYQTQFIDAFLSDVRAFLDFLSLIKGNEEKSINKEIIKLLLKERNLDDYYEAFNSNNYDSDWIEIHDVAKLLNRFFDKQVIVDVNDDNLEDDQIQDFLVSVSGIEGVGVKQSEQDKDIDQQSLDNEVKFSKRASDERKHYPIIEAYTEPQDFIIHRDMIEHQPEIHLVSLEYLIDEKSKKLIQKKIFKKDEEAYENFVERLEKIDNWKKAKQIIDDELMLRYIQPFSREALILGDLIFNRYFPKKN